MNDTTLIERSSNAIEGKTRPKVSPWRLAIIAAAATGVVGVLAFASYWWTTGRFIESTDDAYVGGDITVIAPKVAGFISEVAVKDNQPVRAGDILIRLDDRDYRAALARAEAAGVGHPQHDCLPRPAGLSGGSMIPTVFTTAFAYFQGHQRVIAAAVIGGLASFAPTLGPTIDGWITDNYSWQWLFFINLLPGAFVAVVVPMLVRVDHPDPALLKSADYPGMLLMAIFLGCLEYTLEEGPRWNWMSDESIRTTAWIAGLSGVAFIWRSLACREPVVDLRALKSRNFSLGCLFSFVTGIGIFGTIYLTPVFLGRVEGYSATQIGTAIFSTGLFQLLSIPFYTTLARRVDLTEPCWLMLAVIVTGCVLHEIDLDFTGRQPAPRLST